MNTVNAMNTVNTFRYILDKSSKKFTCPECAKKSWVKYIDTESGDFIPDEYGRCDREVNCGSVNDPYSSGYAKMVSDAEKGENVSNWRPVRNIAPRKKEVPAVSFIPFERLKESRFGYEKNNLVTWLTAHFGSETATDLIPKYQIGTSDHWPGSTVFWQIDIEGKIRTGKVMLYNPENGRRVKQPFNHINWAHKVFGLPDFELKQCLFGEHLIKQYPDKPIAVVESEKTAIISSVYLPQFNWLAVGSLTNLTAERCKSIQGKKVFLFPDLKCFERWSEKAEILRKDLPGINVIVSNILESKATDEEKENGFDIADFLIRRKIEKSLIKPQISEPPVDLVSNDLPETVETKKGSDQFDLEEFRAWTKTVRLPKGHIKLNGQVDIYHLENFITGRMNHIAAFTNYREPGNRSLFIRQLKYIRRHYSTLTSHL